MRTEKQIEASRLNGAKSRGPVTDEGKARSSQNARRHGLLARSLSLQFEDASRLSAFLTDLTWVHQPEGCTEHGLVEAMAIARWKQLRFDCAAKIAVDLQMQVERENPPVYEHQGAAVISTALTHLAEERRGMKEMSLHHARLDREYHRSLNMLLKLQDRRGFKPAPGIKPEPAPAPPPEPAADESPEVSMPDAPEPEESATSSSDFIGILPDAICKKIANRTQASLQTKDFSDPSQVPFTEPGAAQPLPPSFDEDAQPDLEPVTAPGVSAHEDAQPDLQPVTAPGVSAHEDAQPDLEPPTAPSVSAHEDAQPDLEPPTAPSVSAGTLDSPKSRTADFDGRPMARAA